MYTIETIGNKATFENGVEASNYLDAAMAMNLLVSASKLINGKLFSFNKEERCWERQ